jgi:hypothetical protein
MATVNNVILRILPGTNDDNRRVRVDFQVNFNSTEELAGTVFRADVKLRSVDGVVVGGRTFDVRSVIMQAIPGTIPVSVTRLISKTNLDEDLDVRLVGPPHDRHIEIREDIDEWVATVYVSPVVFNGTNATSEMVRGSWGIAAPAV